MGVGIIYEPAGRAKEYCALAVNLYRGCNHRCTYCYAPAATRVKPEQFAVPVPRADIIEKLRKDAVSRPGNGAQVMLSFTSDPYNAADKDHGLTREAIKILKAAGYKIAVLTKAGMAAVRDFDLLDSADHAGATLTFVDPAWSLEWEPGAALPEERFQMLHEAKQRGIFTWASLEPVIDPAQSLEIIRRTWQYVDLYKVGKLNYHPVADGVDWRVFAEDAVETLKRYGKKYYIKESLKKYLTKSA